MGGLASTQCISTACIALLILKQEMQWCAIGPNQGMNLDFVRSNYLAFPYVQAQEPVTGWRATDGHCEEIGGTYCLQNLTCPLDLVYTWSTLGLHLVYTLVYTWSTLGLHAATTSYDY